MTARQYRKQLHRDGKYPEAVTIFPTRRRLGDPPGFYGRREATMDPPWAERTKVKEERRG